MKKMKIGIKLKPQIRCVVPFSSFFLFSLSCKIEILALCEEWLSMY